MFDYSLLQRGTKIQDTKGEKGMKVNRHRCFVSFILSLLFALSLLGGQAPAGKEKHLLYVASPGIRNYEEYGGLGILVFDMDNGFRFVKRIPTWEVAAGAKPENVK